MLTDEIRAAVCHLYQFRRGYCGVREEDVGAELTVDHHQPISQGGSDEPDNLVYCGVKCNLHKGNYWHESHAPHIRLLHPRRDDFVMHLREEDDSHLIGLTPEGQFLIGRLRLNRPALVAFRQNRRQVQQRQEELRAALERERALRQRIEELDALLQAVTLPRLNLRPKVARVFNDDSGADLVTGNLHRIAIGWSCTISEPEPQFLFTTGQIRGPIWKEPDKL